MPDRLFDLLAHALNVFVLTMFATLAIMGWRDDAPAWHIGLMVGAGLGWISVMIRDELRAAHAD